MAQDKIRNADVNPSAAIALTKLAALTNARALASDGSGFISVSAVTATELGYLSGVTSAIQTQLNGKQSTITPAALTKTDDTNITLTLGGTPATALLQPASITVGWTGTLSPTRGGTGVNNGANTLTLGGNVTHSGAFTQQFTATGNTNVTLPVTGTLSTLAGAETLSNKVINQPNIVGVTTNSNAVAGSVGEYVLGSLVVGSATPLVTDVAKTITSISLTAGDWDVTGVVGLTVGGATSIARKAASISQTTNSMKAAGTLGAFQVASATTVSGGFNESIPTGTVRISLASTTTIYLVTLCTFTVSTISAYGEIGARRVR